MTIYCLFKNWVNNTPNAVALQFESESPVTYRELDQRVERYAIRLLNKGIKHGGRVAVCLDRSPDQVIVFLALMKIGAIYIPIDPDTPPERIRSILKDADPKLVLTEHQFSGKFFKTSDSGGRELLFLNGVGTRREMNKLTKLSSPSIKVASDDLAYIIYTSGTTGTPKGVPIKHSGIIYWSTVLAKKHGRDSKNKILANTSVNFDVHIWEYLLAWYQGATLCLTSQETRQDHTSLINFMHKHKVTSATLIPTVIRALDFKKHLKELKTSGLTRVYSTGEACTADIVVAFEDNNIELWNAYGPTEATFGLSIICVEKSMLSKTRQVPIGLPDGSDVKAFVLDDDQKPVKDGTPGQLYIVSPYLTPGYLNKKPSETFVPVGINQHTLLAYPTGDKCIRSDDRIYYLGRIGDFAHVKVNGVKVNPLQVEALLRQLSKVKDVCVVNVPAQDGNQLHAFVVTEENVTNKEFNNHLSAHVSNSVLPTGYTRQQQLPMTLNGKVDRRALAEMAVKHSKTGSIQFTEEQNKLSDNQKKMLDIWFEIFKTNQIDIYTDRFDDLGGDSLQFNQLVLKLNRVFGLKLSVSALASLKKITVAQLTYVVEQRKTNNDIVQAITCTNSGGSIFLIPPITGESIATYKELAGALTNQLGVTVYGLTFRGLIDGKINNVSIVDTAKDYAYVIANTQPKGGIYLLGWSFGGMVAYEVAQHLRKIGRKVSYLGLVDSLTPMIYQRLSSKNYLGSLQQLERALVLSLKNKKLSFNDNVIKGLETCKEKTQLVKQFFKGFQAVGENTKRILDTVKANLLAVLAYRSNSQGKRFGLNVYVASETKGWLKKSTENDFENRDTYTFSLGWSEFGKVIIDQPIDSDHFGLVNNQPVIEELVEQIESDIDEKLGHDLSSDSTSDTESTSSEEEKAFDGMGKKDSSSRRKRSLSKTELQSIKTEILKSLREELRQEQQSEPKKEHEKERELKEDFSKPVKGEQGQQQARQSSLFSRCTIL